MTLRLIVAAIFGVMLGAPCQAQVKAQKKADVGAFGGVWYSAIELRHHLNTYFDQDGFYSHQTPSAHARWQFGAQFYEGMVDTYLTLGVYKTPGTQQVLQRRPEIAVDLYPFKGQYLTIQQYNLAQLPYRDTQKDPESEEIHANGTIYTFGIAPALKTIIQAPGLKIEPKISVDGWTRLYSQKQFTESYRRDFEDGDDEPRFGVAGDDEVNNEPIEDFALHYRTIFAGGFGAAPDQLPALSAEATANFHSRFEPVYTRTEEGTDYRYVADRYSNYRFRLSYAVNERINLVNDFYHFFEGAFAGKREGDERRYRNIARITCKL